MFVGAIPSPIRSMLREAFAKQPPEDLWVGCSGAFTVERTLHDLPCRMVGNDVSLLSCAFGAYLAGAPLTVTVKDEAWKWLDEFLTPGPAQLATLQLCTAMLQGVGKTSAYYLRVQRAFRSQWAELHADTQAKIEKTLLGMKLGGFACEDVVEFVRRSPATCAIVTFPPTYKGGYERLYKGLDAVFEWARPTYEMFDEPRMEELLDLVLLRPRWMVARDHEIPRLQRFERARVRSSGKRELVVYSTEALCRVVSTDQVLEPVDQPRLVDHEIGPGSRMWLAALTPGEFNTLRAENMSKRIQTANTSGLQYAVLVDGRVIGAFMLVPGTLGISEVYVMSDFAIGGSAYPRLSKLVLAAILSTEARSLAEQKWCRRCWSVMTTAFTEKASSMKYRGLFEEHSGKEDHVNYQAPAGRWSLAEGLAWWVEKHGKRRSA